jgi:hypothetical protein
MWPTDVFFFIVVGAFGSDDHFFFWKKVVWAAMSTTVMGVERAAAMSAAMSASVLADALVLFTFCTHPHTFLTACSSFGSTKSDASALLLPRFLPSLYLS